MDSGGQSAEALEATGDADKKPDWDTCGPAKKSEAVEQALKQCVENKVDVYALTRTDKDKLVNVFENCTWPRLKNFMKNNVDLPRIAGADPMSLEEKLKAARGRRGNEADARYKAALEAAVDTRFPRKTDGVFDGACAAKTPRLRAGALGEAFDARRIAFMSQRDALAKQIRLLGPPLPPTPSASDVDARVQQLARDAAEELEVKARPKYVVFKRTDAGWDERILCEEPIDVSKALGIADMNIVRGLMRLRKLPDKHAHLKDIYKVEPYDPDEHGTYDAARVAARFDDGIAFSAVGLGLASSSAPTDDASTAAGLNNADAIGETAAGVGELKMDDSGPAPSAAFDGTAMDTRATSRLALDSQRFADAASAARAGDAAAGPTARIGSPPRSPPASPPGNSLVFQQPRKRLSLTAHAGGVGVSVAALKKSPAKSPVMRASRDDADNTEITDAQNEDMRGPPVRIRGSFADRLRGEVAAAAEEAVDDEDL